MNNKTVTEKYEKLTKLLIEKNISITAMESCSGGVIAALITDTEGASSIFRGSYVTYSNEAKIACGVPENVIAAYGVYSEETARAMAESCRVAFGADIGIGITGTFADPDPANADSVPGEVFFAICMNLRGMVHLESRTLKGVSGSDRREARMIVADAVADVILGCLPLFEGI